MSLGWVGDSGDGRERTKVNVLSSVLIREESG